MPSNPALAGLEESASQVVSELRPGRIVLITGASGSGKSSLLAELARRIEGEPIRVHELYLPDEVAVDCFPQLELEEALGLLCQFGLGEVYTYLSPARKLSTGQQFRLRLAMAWARACRRPATIVCDEFATQLDQVSAGVIARLVRRLVTGDGRPVDDHATSAGSSAQPMLPAEYRRKHATLQRSRREPLALVAASCHEGIARALKPDVVVRCDFGQVTIGEGLAA